MTSKTSPKSTDPSARPALTQPTSRAAHSPPHTPAGHHHPNIPNNTHIFSRVDHPAHPSAPTRRKRQAQGIRFPQQPVPTSKEMDEGSGSTVTKKGSKGFPTPSQADLLANQTSTSPLTIWKVGESCLYVFFSFLNHNLLPVMHYSFLVTLSTPPK